LLKLLPETINDVNAFSIPQKQQKLKVRFDKIIKIYLNFTQLHAYVYLGYNPITGKGMRGFKNFNNSDILSGTYT